MKFSLKHMHGVKTNTNSLGTYQLLIGGGRMRGVHGKKRDERESVRAMGERVGKREPWGRERENEAE